MAELTMPKMGDAMEEGTLLQWLKKEGDHVKEEEPVAEIETEKATIEIPSYQSGILTQILIQEGQTVPVGTPIALIQADGEAAAPAAAKQSPEKAPPPREEQAPVAESGSAKADAPAPETAKEPAAAAAEAEEPPRNAGRARHRGASAEPPEPAREEDVRVKASPLARKIASERGIDLRDVHGTGPGGRIVEADLEEQMTPRAEPARPAVGRVETAPPEEAVRPRPVTAAPAAEVRDLTPMRRTIARRLLESKQTIPHYYVTSEIDMEAAVAIRDQLHAADPERPKIPLDALMVRACALALRKFPVVNSQFDVEANKLRLLQDVSIGIAVALPEGLIVPVVRQADQKSVTHVAAEIRQLAERARAGQLQPAEFSGGTFTISNLGMYDVESFSAIINPPEVAILAVGTIAQVPVVKNGAVTVGQRMKVTISADHRVVDGAVAAQFLQEVKRLLQSPLLLV